MIRGPSLTIKFVRQLEIKPQREECQREVLVHGDRLADQVILLLKIEEEAGETKATL